MASAKKFFYTYKANADEDEILVPNDGAFYPGVFAYIRSLVAPAKILINSLSLRVFPMGYVESSAEIAIRRSFRKDAYLLVAAIIDGNDDLVSFLLVEKDNCKSAIVVSSNLEVEVALHDGLKVAEDDEASYPIDVFLMTLKKKDLLLSEEPSAIPSSKVLDLGSIEEEEEEEDAPVVMPTLEKKFTPNSKKSIANLGKAESIRKEEEIQKEEEREYVAPKLEKTFLSNSSKPKNLGSYDSPKQTKKPLERKRSEPIGKPAFTPNTKGFSQQEKPIAPPAKTETKEVKEPSIPSIPSFQAGKKGKIPNLGSYTDNRRQKQQEEVKIPAKPSESFQKEEEKDYVPISISKPAFSANKKAGPRKLDSIRSDFFSSTWSAIPRATFYPNPKRPHSVIHLNEPNGKYDFSYIAGKIRKKNKAFFSKYCAFTPSIPSPDDPRLEIVQFFAPEDWHVLACFCDAYGRDYSYLLCYIANPNVAFVLSGEDRATVFSFSFEGYYLPTLHMGYQELLDEAFYPHYQNEEEEESEPVEETKAEEPVQEEIEELAEEPKEEEIVFIPKPKRVVYKPIRKVYFTSHFRKRKEAFLRSHPGAEEEFAQLIYQMQMLPEAQLKDFFKRMSAAKIRDSWKCHFSNSPEYGAARVFFLEYPSLKQLDRRFEQDSILLIGISSQAEHDEQSRVEKIASAALDANSQIYICPPPSSAKREEEIDLYVLSQSQYRCLENGKMNLPAAFVGAAGSGKTLLSYQAYIDMKEGKDDNVLYLTYEKELVKKAILTLTEMGVDKPSAYTFKELMGMVFGREEIKRMRLKDDFREWFYDRIEKAHDINFTRLSEKLSPNIEDAFSIAYVFYRGIIEGCAEGYEKRKGKILSKKEFLSRIDGEDGFDKEQKEAIYEIASYYERQLKDEGGLTDNKFALRILEQEESMERFDAIIVDEYQDLTELQLLAVTRLLKSGYVKKLLIFGDDNQAVNPTILNISGVKAVIHKAFHSQYSLEVSPLSSTYRTGKSLFSYILEVLAVKDKAIGKDKGENVVPKKTFRDDEDDLFITLIDDPSLLEELMSAAKGSNRDAVFIFPNATLRDKAKEKYHAFLDGYEMDNFLSVEESKGREWDSCILMDFISSSRDEFEKMLGEDRIGHRSTFHRMMFNRYYVALTRASNRIIVYESRAGETARERLLSPLRRIAGKGDIHRIFSGNLDPAHWIEIGDAHFRKGDYPGASRAYRRGKDDKRSLSRLERSEAYRSAFEGRHNLEEDIMLFLSYEDLDALENYCKEKNHIERADLIQILRDEKKGIREKRLAFEEMLPFLFEEEAIIYFTWLCAFHEKEILPLLSRLSENE